MARILILMTKARTLGLLDGRQHPSGFWAEEFVVPYERFVAAGYDVDVATIGGATPTPDEGSLTPMIVGFTRPAGSPDNDEKNCIRHKVREGHKCNSAEQRNETSLLLSVDKVGKTDRTENHSPK